MVLKKLAYGIAAASLIATPIAASAQGSQRASQPTATESEMEGGSVVPIVLMVAAIAGAIWLVVDDDDDDDEPVSA